MSGGTSVLLVALLKYGVPAIVIIGLAMLAIWYAGRNG